MKGKRMRFPLHLPAMKVRIFLLLVFLILFVVIANTMLSLDFERLSIYGQGYLAGNGILLFGSILGLFFTGRSIFKKISL